MCHRRAQEGRAPSAVVFANIPARFMLLAGGLGGESCSGGDSAGGIGAAEASTERTSRPRIRIVDNKAETKGGVAPPDKFSSTAFHVSKRRPRRSDGPISWRVSSPQSCGHRIKAVRARTAAADAQPCYEER